MKKITLTDCGYVQDDHSYTRAFSMWRMEDRRFWMVCALTSFGITSKAVVDDFGNLVASE